MEKMKSSKALKTLKLFLDIITYNFRTIFHFELIFKVALGLFLMPAWVAILNFTMQITSFSYLTIDNVLQFLVHPFTLIILIAIIIVLTTITIFDISTIIVIFDYSYHHKKISVLSAIKISLKKLRKLYKLKNLGAAFLVILLIPLFNMSIISNLVFSINIPEFIKDYIFSNPLLIFSIVFAYIFIVFLIGHQLYTMHYMVLEEKSFKHSKVSSSSLIKKRKIRDIFCILFIQFILALLYIAIIAVGLMLIVALKNLFDFKSVIDSFLISIVLVFVFVVLTLSTIFTNISSYAILSGLFYKHKKSKNEKVLESVDVKKPKEDVKKRWIFVQVIVMILAVVGIGIFTYQVESGDTNFNVEYIKNVEITAHRGASLSYPENTMAAFKAAKELGADWIELDVQETKDGKIVIAHDRNLGRVTGVNKNVDEMSFDEIRKLDAGKRKNKKFEGEKVPTLNEVIKFAKKNNIRLNIEIKPVNNSASIEEKVVKIIKQNEFEKMCVVSSLNYDALKNVKNISKKIKTVYNMALAIGKITELEYADAFSVEAMNVNENLVSLVHNSGKEIYAWTVNSEEKISRMINLRVDNIITDDIKTGKMLVDRRRSSDWILNFLEFLK